MIIRALRTGPRSAAETLRGNELRAWGAAHYAFTCEMGHYAIARGCHRFVVHCSPIGPRNHGRPHKRADRCPSQAHSSAIALRSVVTSAAGIRRSQYGGESAGMAGRCSRAGLYRR